LDDWCELDLDELETDELDLDELEPDERLSDRLFDPELRCGVLDGAAACVGALLCGCDLGGAAACGGALLLCGCDLDGALCDDGRLSRRGGVVCTSRRELLTVPELRRSLPDLANVGR
jgi:hypothetical protein